jgi:hypothetical protein
MISWRIPGSGWTTWSTASISTIIDASTQGWTRATTQSNNIQTIYETRQGLTSQQTIAALFSSRIASTSTTQADTVSYVATTTANRSTSQPTVNTTGTRTFFATTSVLTTLPVSTLITTVRTNTVTTQSGTELPNGIDATVYQAVGNEVLWVLPLATTAQAVAATAISDIADTTTRTTAYERTESVSRGVGPSFGITNAAKTNAVLSYHVFGASTITVTSASGNTLPNVSFTRTLRVTTTTGTFSYQFSSPSNAHTVFGLSSIPVTSNISTTQSWSYLHGTYSQLVKSTSSWFEFVGNLASDSLTRNVELTGFFYNVTVTAGGVAARLPYVRGGSERGQPPVAVSVYGNAAAVEGSDSGIGYSAPLQLLYNTVSVNRFGSTTILPQSKSGMLGSGSSTTRQTVSWSNGNFTATTSNSDTSSTVSGSVEVFGESLPTSYASFAVLGGSRSGGVPPGGVTYAIGTTASVLAKVNGQTEVMFGQTTWTSAAEIAALEAVSSATITGPVDRDVSVWAVSAYSRRPYPPYIDPSELE